MKFLPPSVQHYVAVRVIDYSSHPWKKSLQLLFWNYCWTFLSPFSSVFNQAWNFLPLKKPLKSSHFLWIIPLWTTLLYSKKRTIFCHLETHASFWTEINPLIKLIRSTIPLERARDNMMGYKLNHRFPIMQHSQYQGTRPPLAGTHHTSTEGREITAGKQHRWRTGNGKKRYEG